MKVENVSLTVSEFLLVLTSTWDL